LRKILPRFIFSAHIIANKNSLAGYAGFLAQLLRKLYYEIQELKIQNQNRARDHDNHQQ
jgi:hypothetical protein